MSDFERRSPSVRLRVDVIRSATHQLGSPNSFVYVIIIAVVFVFSFVAGVHRVRWRLRDAVRYRTPAGPDPSADHRRQYPEKFAAFGRRMFSNVRRDVIVDRQRQPGHLIVVVVISRLSPNDCCRSRTAEYRRPTAAARQFTPGFVVPRRPDPGVVRVAGGPLRCHVGRRGVDAGRRRIFAVRRRRRGRDERLAERLLSRRPTSGVLVAVVGKAFRRRQRQRRQLR